MTGGRHLVWILLGFLAVSALASFGVITPALAQQPELKPSTIDQPAPARVYTRKDDATQPETFDGDAAPDLPDAYKASDPTNIREQDDDGLEPGPGEGQRGVILDGDPNYPAERPAIRDGIVDDGEPPEVEDGIDPLKVDTREKDDIAAFENPPAGYDPLLFQIEDIDPVADRRTKRLSKLEPFDPVGMRIGNFVLFPELDSSAVYRSNVFYSPVPRGDVAFEFKPTMRLASDWNVHALEFMATGLFSAYTEFDSENNKNYALETRGRLDVTSRTNLQGLASYEQYEESRSAIDASSAGERALVTVQKANSTFTHRFNRLTVQLRGGVGDYDYGPQTNLGVVTTNDDRDRIEYDQAVRATWEFKPSFSVFTEVALNQREYDTPASDLILRSSTGERYRVGVDFGKTGAFLRGEAAIGYGSQKFDDSQLQDADGLFVDSNVTWRMSEISSLLLSARTEVSETTTSFVGGVLRRDAGLELRHAFSRYLIASAGIAVAMNDYVGSTIEEQDVRTTLGLEYFVNRETILYSNYIHSNFYSNTPGEDYSSDEVRVGIRLRR